MTAVGVLWIVIMTAIVVIGIELSARTQVGLLAAEIVTLALFAVVALVKVYTGDAGPDAVHPSLSWINPFALSPSEISAGMLLAVFIYWGWDTTATVNEETEDPGEAPGRATVISTLILLGIYLVVAFAAQAYDGVKGLTTNPKTSSATSAAEVFGSPLDKILIIAVLTSAAASTQTTILPTARTTLSMARAHAMPKSLGKVHPRFLTPHVSTILMGAALGRLVRRPDPGQRRHPLRLARRARPDDRLLHRPDRLRLRDLLPARAPAQRQELLLHRRRPAFGGAILFYLLVKNGIELSDPANSESGNSWFGLGPPLVIAVFFLVLGVVLMFVQWRKPSRSSSGASPRSCRPGFLEGEASPSRRPPGTGVRRLDGPDRRRLRRLGLRQCALDGRSSSRQGPGRPGRRRLRLRAAGHLGRRDRRPRGGDRGARREGDGRGARSGPPRSGIEVEVEMVAETTGRGAARGRREPRRADDRGRQLRARRR